ncbi:MAG: hypothetical protein HPY44_01400 [Armatimonadetes bacterium]|nr:hypothetical protein [Armatimonadota bacterium]
MRLPNAMATKRSAATASAVVLALALGVFSGAVIADTPAADGPEAMVQRACALIAEGKRDNAEEQLLAAIRAYPDHIPAFLTLGDLYEKADRIEEAAQLYAHVLGKLAPRNEAAQRAIKRAFYRGRFPREIALDMLPLAPAAFAGHVVKLSEEFHFGSRPTRTFAYTTSLIFPAALEGNRAAPWIRLPSSIGPAENMLFNRVAYGFIADDRNEVLRARWQAGWPSSTVLPSRADHETLAQRLLQLALRGHVYLLEYLDFDRKPEKTDLLELYLTEAGPSGAEQLGDRIFFYDAESVRAPEELVRQLFHELGHLMLPRIGPFPGDDVWASGDVGERLLFQWLLEEAGTVTGDPWPSERSAEALHRLCGISAEEAKRFLMRECRVPVNAWMATLPEEFTGEDGAARFAGFCLWLEAAHGRSTLAAVLHGAQGTEPTQFVQAYKEIVGKAFEDGGALLVDAGALNLMASRLLQAPREAAVRRELVALGKGGEAVFRIYLPDGDYDLEVLRNGSEQALVNVTLDGQSKLVGNTDQPASLTGVTAGWHDVVISCGSDGPLEILGLRIRRDKPAG